ncbi:hypothetical protein DFH09DRAFT_1043991 [Mycena vulgaris]|nr:hypothetical protein DFH09DRAFT_1043991 [Mycena vulgaris]
MADKSMVIREVAANVWTFSRPFARFGIFPVGGRSTAIKLANGGVWALASTPLDPETKAKIDELGPVQYIISPDAMHFLFLGEFKKAYPTAKLIAVDAVARAEKILTFDGIWGRDPPDTKYGFEEDVRYSLPLMMDRLGSYFSGFKIQNKDVAFFHPASATLIEADLIFNLPCTEQYSKTKSSGAVPLPCGPSSWTHRRLSAFMGDDKAAMKRDVRTVGDWDFQRIIPCHDYCRIWRLTNFSLGDP